MKERQRWTAEEDSILSAYVKQFGPREWHLVSQRMNTTLDRDAKSCLERWKNYLKPGIKKGSLTAEEQRLVIRLQAKHGNKWKKIAAEVPGRTAKRLGKWWEVYKEKQQRANKETNKCLEPIDEGKYDHILETFAEKLVKERVPMAASNGGFLHGGDHPLPLVTAPAAVPSTTMMLPLLGFRLLMLEGRLVPHPSPLVLRPQQCLHLRLLLLQWLGFPKKEGPIILTIPL